MASKKQKEQELARSRQALGQARCEGNQAAIRGLSSWIQAVEKWDTKEWSPPQSSGGK